MAVAGAEQHPARRAAWQQRVTGRIAHHAGRVLRTRTLGHRATAVYLAVTSRIVIANAVAGLLVVTYLTITEDVDRSADWTPTILNNVGFYLISTLVLSVATVMRGRKVFAPAWRFLDEDAPITRLDQATLLRQPARMGFFPLRYWMAAAVITSAGRIAYGGSAGQVVVSAVTVLIGGLVAAATGFLLGERALRPTFALALEGQAPPDRPSLGLGTRLVLVWALGAGLPLVLIALTPFLVPSADLGVNWAIVTLAAIALIAGYTITAMAARSISRPLARVREALREVGEGNLGLDVVVDDGGELGRLQAGVNEMVAGLRERERVEDLFGRHVGTAVAQHALAQGVALGSGQVRCVSALFVDLRGSTALARRRSPQDVVALLNRFFATVVECCDAEGGWLDKFEGDGALCVFGAPVDQLDHADRALRAARAIADRLATLRASGDPDLDAGIGVASGDAVAGHVGTEHRLEYTVIGDPVNTASRLTVAAKDHPERVLAAASALDSATTGEARRWVAAGEWDLKGLDPGLRVFTPRT